MSTGFTSIDPPYFLNDFLKIHLWMCTNESDGTRFVYCGTNTTSSTVSNYLPEWRDNILDTNKFVQIYYKGSHFFQVNPYDTNFFRRELSEAVDCLLANILVIISCKACLHGATDEGEGNQPDGNDVML